MSNQIIKFRFWDKWYSKFVEKDLISINGNGRISYAHGKSVGGDGVNGERFIVQRFTGVQDKDNKDIFEGDIVSVYDKENLFVIKFGTVSRNVQTYDKQSILNLDFNCFYFESLIDGRKYFSITNNHFGEHDLKGTSVICNIFEKRELLKYGSN